MSKSKQYLVKDIQKQLAILQSGDESLSIPASWLPENCSKGDLIRTLVLDEDAKKRKAGLSSLIVFEIDPQNNQAQLERLKGLV